MLSEENYLAAGDFDTLLTSHDKGYSGRKLMFRNGLVKMKSRFLPDKQINVITKSFIRTFSSNLNQEYPHLCHEGLKLRFHCKAVKNRLLTENFTLNSFYLLQIPSFY